MGLFKAKDTTVKTIHMLHRVKKLKTKFKIKTKMINVRLDFLQPYFWNQICQNCYFKDWNICKI